MGVDNWIIAAAAVVQTALLFFIYKLQRAFEADRRRVDTHVSITNVPSFGAGNPPQVTVHFYNLNERGILWRSVTATARAEGLEEVTVTHTVEKIIPGFSEQPFDVGPGLAIKALALCGEKGVRFYNWQVEAKCDYFAQGREHVKVGFIKDVLLHTDFQCGGLPADYHSDS